MSVILELAVFNIASVEVAEQNQVQRIELCRNYAAGGITPLMSDFIIARKLFSGKIFVMIRPRAGDYFYSPCEFTEMLNAVIQFKLAGADGFVSGFLSPDNNVDEEQTKLFVDACAPLPVTFHRAIDDCANYEMAVKKVVACGVKRILSTGVAATAFQGKELLNRMQIKYAEKLIVVAGGAVRSSGLATFLDDSSITEIHSAAVMMQGSDVADAGEVKMLMKLI